MTANQPTSSEQPVLIRGMSRSGGTLMVAMLDAHPQIAMSYELYPKLLKFDNGNRSFIEDLADRVASAPDLRHAAELETDYWKKFVFRCPRSGITQTDLANLLQEHINADMDFLDDRNRLEFIARCARLKMTREGKTRWGIKCAVNFDIYFDIWPDARFIFMIRDGRDMLASQMNVGSFNITPVSFAQTWMENIQSFREFSINPAVYSKEVIYEQLVNEPESMLAGICDFLEVQYSSVMLNYHQYDNTLFRNPTGHLSYKQLKQGLNSDSIGRWRHDLSSDDINYFVSVARSLLQEYGYDMTDNHD